MPFQKDDETNGEAITAAGPEDFRNVRQNCGGTNRARKQEEINAVAMFAMIASSLTLWRPRWGSVGELVSFLTR